MNKTTISQEVLKQIQEKKIEPKPKWQFLARNYMVWGAGSVCVVVGGLSLSVMAHMARVSDWELYANADGSALTFAIENMPYLWIVVMVLFILLANYNLKHTKSGYKYRLASAVVVVIGASVFVGGIFHVMNIGRALDSLFEERVPYYAQFMAPRHAVWMNPEQGLLTGKITDDASDDSFIMVDIYGGEWEVLFEKPELRGMEIIKAGLPVRIIGEAIDDYLFKAYIIKVLPPEQPFGPKEKFYYRFKKIKKGEPVSESFFGRPRTI
ncbi:MAG: hypothetical protein ABIG66_01270 [Candidatus Kerfeldbacteria bacterium]